MVIEATILPRISSQMPSRQIEFTSWPHLKGLPLVDPEFYQLGAVDILLGAENFVSILSEGHRKDKAGESDVLNIIFGWVLMGTVATPHSQPIHSFVSTFDDLEDTIRKFWDTKDVPNGTSLSVNDQRCETLFKEITRLVYSSISVCRESTLFCSFSSNRY